MGWASGSSLAEGIWDEVKEHIPEDKKQEVARNIISKFEEEDCDTMDECEELQEAAKLPQFCWECDKDVPWGQLSEDDLCSDCAKEEIKR